MSEGPSASEQIRRLFEDTESGAAKASEELVRGEAFSELLARMTENVMALTRIGFTAADLVVRNLRLAGRADLVRLGRQLGRTEDKLERVLQEVEALRDQVAALERPARSRNGRAGGSRSGGSRGTSSNGRASGSRGSSGSRGGTRGRGSRS